MLCVLAEGVEESLDGTCEPGAKGRDGENRTAGLGVFAGTSQFQSLVESDAKNVVRNVELTHVRAEEVRLGEREPSTPIFCHGRHRPRKSADPTPH
jgi:hypothetical protein